MVNDLLTMVQVAALCFYQSGATPPIAACSHPAKPPPARESAPPPVPVLIFARQPFRAQLVFGVHPVDLLTFELLRSTVCLSPFPWQVQILRPLPFGILSFPSGYPEIPVRGISSHPSPLV